MSDSVRDRSTYGEHITLEPLLRPYVWASRYSNLANSEQMMIGTVLTAQDEGPESADRDARLRLAKSNFDRYLDVLMRAQGTAAYETIQRHRVADLQKLREQIAVV